MSKSILILLITFSLLVTATLGESSDWQYYTSDKDGNLLFYDKENVMTSDSIIQVNQKIIYNENILSRIRERFGDKYADLTEIVNLVEIDCPGKRSKSKSVTYYNSKGTLIESRNYEGRQDWTLIPQKTELNMLYELCCHNEWVYVTSSTDEEYFLNIRSMQINDSNVSFWMKGINRKTAKEAERDKFTIKCKNGTYALRHHIKHQSDGSLSKAVSYEDYLEWSGIPSNTIMDFFQKLLCIDSQPRKDVKFYLKTISQK